MNAQLLSRAKLTQYFFYPFGAIESSNIIQPNGHFRDTTFVHGAFFYDQEPFDLNQALKVQREKIGPQSQKRLLLMAMGERNNHSRELRQQGFLPWNYFYHGFAALDWYRDGQYLVDNSHSFSDVFITFNRLCTGPRAYRLDFVARIIEQDLLKRGRVSLHHKHGDNRSSVEDELNSSDCKLSDAAKQRVGRVILPLEDNLVIDEPIIPGSVSANLGPDEVKLWQSALWHVVTETVFYEEKQHLTEKIFKPIVARRPFILLGAQHNLAYLREYGFKTFDRWIDESYDSEPDPEKRTAMVVEELNKLCMKSKEELKAMYWEMLPTLEYNHTHMYGEFKNIIVNELVDNFESCIRQWNVGRIGDKVLPLDTWDFPEIKQRLAA